MFRQMSENADDVSSQLSSVIEDLAQGDTDVRDKQIRDDWGRHPATKYLRRCCTYYMYSRQIIFGSILLFPKGFGRFTLPAFLKSTFTLLCYREPFRRCNNVV